MDPLLRLIKSVCFAVITFASILYLTGNVKIALLIALLPLASGVFGVLEKLGSLIVGVSLIAAVGWAVLPIEARARLEKQAREWQAPLPDREAAITSPPAATR